MKIASINTYQTKPHFAGENSKTNKLKNAAGAAVHRRSLGVRPLHRPRAAGQPGRPLRGGGEHPAAL